MKGLDVNIHSIFISAPSGSMRLDSGSRELHPRKIPSEVFYDVKRGDPPRQKIHKLKLLGSKR
jgi:hypothetical protein